jgi:hypothetical protein
MARWIYILAEADSEVCVEKNSSQYLGGKTFDI